MDHWELLHLTFAPEASEEMRLHFLSEMAEVDYDFPATRVSTKGTTVEDMTFARRMKGGRIASLWRSPLIGTGVLCEMLTRHGFNGFGYMCSDDGMFESREPRKASWFTFGRAPQDVANAIEDDKQLYGLERAASDALSEVTKTATGLATGDSTHEDIEAASKKYFDAVVALKAAKEG